MISAETSLSRLEWETKIRAMAGGQAAAMRLARACRSGTGFARNAMTLWPNGSIGFILPPWVVFARGPVNLARESMRAEMQVSASRLRGLCGAVAVLAMTAGFGAAAGDGAWKERS
ncbi:MAG: hypothetical protein J0H08_16060, partial [Rhizobiales bacterium]|nr:hypothetical protein [Hyphomicrobiales bacterium]